MAIKNLRFSFDLPITELLALIATRNEGLHIDVIGDGKEAKTPKQLKNGKAAIAGLLEGPKSNRDKHPKVRGADANRHPISAREVITKTLLAAPENTSTSTVLREAVASVGLKPQSASPQLSVMRKDGDVKQIEKGTYKVTAQGLRNFAKRVKERDERLGAAQ